MRFLSVQKIFSCIGILLLTVFSPLAYAQKEIATVDVSRLSNNLFIVEYNFPAPISGFRFERGAPALAEKGLKLLTEGMEYSNQTIRYKSGEKFTTVKFELQRPVSILREFDPVITLSNGGSAFFSSNLELNFGGWLTSFKIHLGRDQLSQILGVSHASTMTWQSEGGRNIGSYIYIGEVTPKKDEQVSYIIDPVAPDWVVDDVRQTIKRILPFYATRFGDTQALHPTVFLSMEALADSGTNFRGDTSQGQFLRLNLYGGGWKIKTESKQNQLRRLVAHELFHFWNSELSVPKDGELPWLHEGSADYMALRALSLNKLATPQYVLDELNTALNNCVLGASSLPLSKIASSSDHQRLYYDCGVLIFYLIDSVETTSTLGTSDVVKVLMQLFGKDYSKAGLFDIVQSNLFTEVQEFVVNLEKANGLALGFELRSILDLYRIPYMDSPFDHAPEIYVESLMAAILQSDCTKGTGYWNLNNGIKVDSDMGCKQLKDFPIVRDVMGFNVKQSPEKAYRRMTSICKAASGAVELTLLNGAIVSIQCRRELPELTPDLYLKKLPWDIK